MYTLSLFLCSRSSTGLFDIGPHVVTFTASDRSEFEHATRDVIGSMLNHKGLALFVSGPGIDYIHHACHV